MGSSGKRPKAEISRDTWKNVEVNVGRTQGLDSAAGYRRAQKVAAGRGVYAWLAARRCEK